MKIFQCSFCVHLRRKPREEMTHHTCDAFPDGIPDEVGHNRFIHIKPYPGDNGILFEHDPDMKFHLDIEGLAEDVEARKHLPPPEDPMDIPAY